MQEDIKDIIIYEIRELRKEVKEINNSLSRFKGFMSTVAVIAGAIGHYVSKKLGL